MEDAKACGAILSAALLDTDTNLEHWYDLQLKTKTSLKSKKAKKAKKTEFPSPNPQGSLLGHNIVFTGKLSITRNKAAHLAAHKGCILSKSIQWHTNYLIIGNQKKSAVGKSTKQIQAEAFNDQGHNIRILNEDEFHLLLNNA